MICALQDPRIQRAGNALDNALGRPTALSIKNPRPLLQVFPLVDSTGLNPVDSNNIGSSRSSVSRRPSFHLWQMISPEELAAARAEAEAEARLHGMS